MTPRIKTHIDPEQFVSRLDRVRQDVQKSQQEDGPRLILAELQERITAAYGELASGLSPMLQQIAAHINALFPVAGGTAPDESQHVVHKQKLELLFAALEDVLYAMSLSKR